MEKGQQLPPVDGDPPTKPALRLLLDDYSSGNRDLADHQALQSTSCMVIIALLVDFHARPLSGPLFPEESELALNILPIWIAVVVTP